MGSGSHTGIKMQSCCVTAEQKARNIQQLKNRESNSQETQQYLGIGMADVTVISDT